MSKEIESPPGDNVPDASVGVGSVDTVTVVERGVTGVAGREVGTAVVPAGVAFTDGTGEVRGDVAMGVVFICSVPVHPAAIIARIAIITREKNARFCISP